MSSVNLLLQEFWMTLGEMSPYLLFGFLVAGFISVFLSAATVERHLGARRFGSIVKASLFGIPLPLCSCGVIPVAMGLRKHGAGKGASVSFLLSTPQTGVDSIAVTYSLLGPVMAIFRPVTTFLTGVLGGSLVEVFDKEDSLKESERCHDSCCSAGTSHKKVKFKLVHALEYGFFVLPRSIGGAMLVGLLIAALISAFVPATFFTDTIGPGWPMMLLMMVVGIPMYVCSTASVPIAAALILKGVSPGAVIVFLMTGPATNAAALATIWKVLGSKSTLIYLGTVIGCALGFGFLLDWFSIDLGMNISSDEMNMLPGYMRHISAVVLLFVLIYPIAKKRLKGLVKLGKKD